MNSNFPYGTFIFCIWLLMMLDCVFTNPILFERLDQIETQIEELQK